MDLNSSDLNAVKLDSRRALLAAMQRLGGVLGVGGKGIEEHFGRDIKEMVSGFPAGKVVVHDTAVAGRTKFLDPFGE